jgi:hypothetical protein
MSLDKMIPLALVVQMFAAAAVCALCRKWLDAAYWAGGAVLNLSVFLRP